MTSAQEGVAPAPAAFTLSNCETIRVLEIDWQRVAWEMRLCVEQAHSAAPAGSIARDITIAGKHKWNALTSIKVVITSSADK